MLMLCKDLENLGREWMKMQKITHIPQPNMELWNIGLQSNLAKPPRNLCPNKQKRSNKLELNKIIQIKEVY